MKSAQPADELHVEFVSRTLEVSRRFDVSVRDHIEDGVFNVDTWWVDLVAALPTKKLTRLVKNMGTCEGFNEHFMPALANELRTRTAVVATNSREEPSHD